LSGCSAHGLAHPRRRRQSRSADARAAIGKKIAPALGRGEVVIAYKGELGSAAVVVIVFVIVVLVGAAVEIFIAIAAIAVIAVLAVSLAGVGVVGALRHGIAARR